MSVYVSDLAEQVGDETEGERVLGCPRCGAEFSADLADYWHLDLNQNLRCDSGHARAELELVVKQVAYQETTR